MESALQAACERFELGELLAAEPVSEAWSNDVFRVRTANQVYALKLFPSGRTAREELRDAMAYEADVLTSGLVPMPRPVSAGDSWLAEIPTPAGIRLARCHEWVEGAPASAAPFGPDQLRSVGHTLGVLHAFHRDGGDSSQLPTIDRERWQRCVAAAAAAGFGWAPALAGLAPVVEELASHVDEVRAQRRPMRISHRDLDPKNAVVCLDGRVAITDWDYAGPVLAEVELVVAAMSFADPADPDGSLRTFVSAYRDAGGDAEPSDRLGLAVEAADVDWLLRNVEACLRADLDDDLPARHRTVDQLIASYRAGTAELQAWADRIAEVG